MPVGTMWGRKKKREVGKGGNAEGQREVGKGCREAGKGSSEQMESRTKDVVKGK